MDPQHHCGPPKLRRADAVCPGEDPGGDGGVAGRARHCPVDRPSQVGLRTVL